MNILGEKVILRAISMEDSQLLLDLINDDDTESMLGGYSFPVSAEQQKRWIAELSTRTDILRCIVACKDDVNVGVGTVILSDIDYKNGTAQIHIKLASNIGRGKGFGTDAVNTMVKYAFKELRLHCVYADVLEYNIPSQKLFAKCGFEKDGVLRARVYKNGKYVNVFSFSRLDQL